MSISLMQIDRQCPPARLTPTAPLPPVLQSEKGTERADRAARMRAAKAEVQNVAERIFVQAIDRWLDGGMWEGAHWAQGSVRLREQGDVLAHDGIPIVARHPARLLDLPEGKRTVRPLEARALAAVAVRGDAGFYDGMPRRVRAEGRPESRLGWPPPRAHRALLDAIELSRQVGA